MPPAQFTLRPAPLGDGTESRCLIYMTSAPPISPAAVLPPDTPPELVEWVELLQQMPIMRAAAELQRRHAVPAAAAPPPRVSTGRHSAPDTEDPPPATIDLPEIAPAPVPAAAPADPGGDDAVASEPDPADSDSDVDAYVYEPTEGDDYSLDKKGRRVFHYVAPEGAGFIAVDADNNLLTDTDGNFIDVTPSGVALADKAGRGVFSKIKNLVRSGGASTTELPEDTLELFDAHGAPVEHFPVDAPGSTTKTGVITTRVWGTRRLIFTIAVAAICATFAVLIGIWWGRGAVPAHGAVSPEEVAAYRLNTMPITAMAAFGQDYLETCLTHGDRDQMKARAAALARMSTGGAASSCGWSSGGETQAPKLIAFTGRAKPITGEFSTGRGAYLEFLVSMRDGQTYTWAVPIWVQSDQESNDMVVVGDIGLVPGMRMVVPDGYTPSGEPDPSLASDLQANLLTPYLTAWAASDRTQIDLAVSADATDNAKRGLGGAVTSPDIGQVTAYVDNGQPGVYANGDTATLIVTVTWKVPSSSSDIPSSTQTTGYRINVIRTGGKWQVSDINAGSVNDRAAQTNPNLPLNDRAGSGEPGIAGIVPGEDGGPVEESTTPDSDNQLAPAESSVPESP